MTPLRPVVGSWQRLSLTSRLLFGSGLALAAFGMTLLYTTVSRDVDSYRSVLAERLDNELAFITLTATEQARRWSATTLRCAGCWWSVPNVPTICRRSPGAMPAAIRSASRVPLPPCARRADPYVRLDQFNIVNDTCGHIAGDELLRQICVLLQKQVRDADTLARLGGDEFGVLLGNCPPDQAMHAAEKMLDAVSSYRFIWQNNSYVIGLSIGLVPIIDAEQSMTSVMVAADAACYSAKERGRNRVHVYRPDDTELAQRQGEMQWVARITRALCFAPARRRTSCT